MCAADDPGGIDCRRGAAGGRAAVRAGAGRRRRCRRSTRRRCRRRFATASRRRCCCRTRFSGADAWRAGVPERWGYRDRLPGALLTRAVRAAVARASGGVLPASGARARLSERTLEPRLDRSTSELRDAAPSVLQPPGWDGRAPLVALAPGAAYGGAKRWPAASFAGSRAPGSRDGIGAVLVGAAADRPPRRAWCAPLSGRATGASISSGETDLPTLAGVLVHCRALVTNDSGAMHLAAALGVASRDVRTDRRTRRRVRRSRRRPARASC